MKFILALVLVRGGARPAPTRPACFKRRGAQSRPARCRPRRSRRTRHRKRPPSPAAPSSRRASRRKRAPSDALTHAAPQDAARCARRRADAVTPPRRFLAAFSLRGSPGFTFLDARL
ncbi:hypothetical protein M885DRAFT_536421 [Pelagophyceae sp. CCMP2097]|nr:hypothetical protein M885DRAFT_536421 [Pelagophyceae sp. CCMP2097]